MPALPRSILLLWLAALVLPAQGQAPLTATQPLLELYQPEGAALSKAPGTETTTVFRATAKSHPFNHRASPIAFNGRLFVQWQASRRYSDGPETQVRYAMSVDGRHWSDALVLARPRANARVSSGGWWAFGDTLVAYINVWPKDAEGGFVEYRTSRNGIHWTAPKPVLDSRGQPLAGAMEQGVAALPDGRLLTAVYPPSGPQPSPYFSDHATGLSGWQTAEITGLSGPETGPGWFFRGDGELVMVFGGQSPGLRLRAAISRDRGETWSAPVQTNIPDLRAGQSAGNLPDASAYIVHSPGSGQVSAPLVITTSADGHTFDQSWLLRAAGKAAPRYPARGKRPGYSDPKAAVFGDYLYLAYATGEEDIEVTRVPLAALISRTE